MRVTEIQRPGTVEARRPVRRASTHGVFADLLETAEAGAATAASATGSLVGVGALLAAQGVEDATAHRSKGLASGRAMLDELDDLRRGLILGQVPVAKLQTMAARVRDRQPSGDTGLDAILDEIEIRVAVELAKLGRHQSVTSST